MLNSLNDLVATGRRADALALFARFLRETPDNSIVATRILSALSQRNFALPVARPMRHAGKLGSLQFSPAGDQVLTSGADGLVKIWRADTGALQLTLTNGSAGFARFSPDGRRVIVSSNDGQTRVWDAVIGRLIDRLQGGGANVCPADYRLAVLAPDRSLRIWDGRPNAPLGEALKHVPESCGSPAWSGRPKQFTDHTASILLGIPPGFAVCHLAGDAGQHGWNTYENDKGSLNIYLTKSMVMNIVQTAESAPAVPAWIDLTPPA
ncbi:MAG TPA: hypothetical protein VEL06_14770, partial [Haliangiales bacterium]|nr:hypothetical protein [Haliangiales bacterium]